MIVRYRSAIREWAAGSLGTICSGPCASALPHVEHCWRRCPFVRQVFAGSLVFADTASTKLLALISTLCFALLR